MCALQEHTVFNTVSNIHMKPSQNVVPLKILAKLKGFLPLCI